LVASIADHDTTVLWEHSVHELKQMLKFGNFFKLSEIAEKLLTASLVFPTAPIVTPTSDRQRSTRKKAPVVVPTTSVYKPMPLESITTRSLIFFHTPHQYALWMGLWVVKLFKIAYSELEEEMRKQKEQGRKSNKGVVFRRSLNLMVKRYSHLQVNVNVIAD
jgi:hypothetical protein